jgi:hypothetical protein
MGCFHPLCDDNIGLLLYLRLHYCRIFRLAVKTILTLGAAQHIGSFGESPQVVELRRSVRDITYIRLFAQIQCSPHLGQIVY